MRPSHPFQVLVIPPGDTDIRAFWFADLQAARHHQWRAQLDGRTTARVFELAGADIRALTIEPWL